MYSSPVNADAACQPEMCHIQIYATRSCPYCLRAKKLLQAKGLSYAEIDVSADESRLQEMMERSGNRSVPQIFIGGEAIGGYHELLKLQQAGKFDS